MALSIDPAWDLDATRTRHLKPFFLSSLQVVNIAQHLLEGELKTSGAPAPGSPALLSVWRLFVSC